MKLRAQGIPELWVGSERLGESPDRRQNILQRFGFRTLWRCLAYCGKAATLGGWHPKAPTLSLSVCSQNLTKAGVMQITWRMDNSGVRECGRESSGAKTVASQSAFAGKIGNLAILPLCGELHRGSAPWVAVILVAVEVPSLPIPAGT